MTEGTQLNRTHKGFYHQKYFHLVDALSRILDLQELESHADGPDGEFLDLMVKMGDTLIDNIHAVEGMAWEEESASPNGRS